MSRIQYQESAYGNNCYSTCKSPHLCNAKISTFMKILLKFVPPWTDTPWCPSLVALELRYIFEFYILNPDQILVEILIQARSVLCSRHISALNISPTETTPFCYKTAVPADTCSLRWQAKTRRCRSRSEIQRPVCNMLPVGVCCVAPVLTGYINNTVSVVSLPLSKIKQYLALSPLPPSCPRFQTYKAEQEDIGKERRGEERWINK